MYTGALAPDSASAGAAGVLGAASDRPTVSSLNPTARLRRVSAAVGRFFGLPAADFWVTPSQLLRRRLFAAATTVLVPALLLWFFSSRLSALRFVLTACFLALLLSAIWWFLRSRAESLTPLSDAAAPPSPGPTRLLGRLWAPAAAEPVVGPVSGRRVLGYRSEVQVLVRSNSATMRLLGRQFQWRTLSCGGAGLDSLWISSFDVHSAPTTHLRLDSDVWEGLSGGVFFQRPLHSAAAPELAPLFAQLPASVAKRVVSARLVEFAVPQGASACAGGRLRAVHHSPSHFGSDSPLVTDQVTSALTADTALPPSAPHVPDFARLLERSPLRFRRRALWLALAAFLLWMVAASISVFEVPGPGNLVVSPRGRPLLSSGPFFAFLIFGTLTSVIWTYLGLVARREEVAASADELETVSHVRADLTARLGRMTETALSTSAPASTVEVWLEDVLAASLRLWGGPPQSEGVGEFPYDEDLAAVRHRFLTADPSMFRARLLAEYPSLSSRAALRSFDAVEAALSARASWAFSAMLVSAAAATELLSSPLGRLLGFAIGDLVPSDGLRSAAERHRKALAASTGSTDAEVAAVGPLSRLVSTLRSRLSR